MSTKRKRSVLSIKDKLIIISPLDKGEKRTNLALEFGISKQRFCVKLVNQLFYTIICDLTRENVH